MTKEKIEFRYYEMPLNEWVLALLGEGWIRPYGSEVTWLHFHNYMEIGVCHYGAGEVVLDKEHYGFQRNDMVIIPPNLPHTTNSAWGTKSFWEWMYFDIESVLDAMFPQDKLKVDKLKDQIYQRPFFFYGDDYPSMEHIINQVVEEMRQKRHLYQESVKGMLRAFVVEVLRMGEEAGQMEENGLGKIAIAPAIQYVEEHYQENVKISHMAGACCLSESHFRKTFHQTMGMRPLDFLNLVRIQKACGLMKATGHSMESIAYKAGFENISTFNRNFKKIMGSAPCHWKKLEGNGEGKFPNCKINVQKGWQ